MTQAGKRSEQVHSCAALYDRASFLAMKLRSLGRDGLAHAAYFGNCAASARACACRQKRTLGSTAVCENVYPSTCQRRRAR